MRRLRSHLLFWLFYWAINCYLDYNWFLENIPGWKTSDTLVRVGVGSLLYILPLIILAYFLVFVSFNHIIRHKKNYLTNTLLIVIPYATAILLCILIMRLIVFPYVYKGAFHPSSLLIEPRRFLSILIEAAFPAALIMSVRYVDTQLEAKARENELIREKLSTELQLLKNQLNPHFLFNTLNNIYSLTRKKSDLAPDAVLRLSELLSFMLYESGDRFVPLSREIRFLEDYIELQKIRFTDRLSIRFEKNIDDPNQQVTPLLLLPLVENAFKHGAAEIQSDSFIEMKLDVADGILHFCIRNNAEQQKPTQPVPKIGLSNTRRQLELIYKDYEIETGFTADVYTVDLKINLNSNGEN